MGKTKDVVDCLRRVHRALVELRPGAADPLRRILSDVEDTLANPAIVDVVERRAAILREEAALGIRPGSTQRGPQVTRAVVPDAVAPSVSLLDQPEPSPESLAEMPEVREDQPALGAGLLRFRRAAALRFSRIQLLNTGEAGTECAALLLQQMAEEYESGDEE